jgi:hypothetical protein
MKTRKQQTGRWLTYAALLLTVGGGLSACRENAIDGLTPQDQAVYVTNRDRSVDFSQYRTFSLPDSVIVESNDRFSPSLTTTESQFVTSVADSLTSRGFQRVERGQPADLGVAVIRVNNRYTGVGVNPYGSFYSNYWYSGGFGSGLGGFYDPFLYPSYYTYQVSDRYWEIRIVDLKNRTTSTANPEQEQLRVIYSATVRGSEVTDANAAQQAVTTLFSQSPYLRVSQ